MVLPTNISYRDGWKNQIFKIVVGAMQAAAEIALPSMLEDWAYVIWLLVFVHAHYHPQRPLVLVLGILYQMPGILASPTAPRYYSGDPEADLAIKSYELARQSFIAMVIMGAIMIAIALVTAIVAIAEYPSRRGIRHSGSYEPRNPVNWEAGAAAHAALGQHPANGTSSPGQELSLMPGAIKPASSLRMKHSTTLQQPAPMPVGKLPRANTVAGGL
ncbi:hypothetical protein F4777DRAFT_578617 [Nemania sp. FL0916]|nr:hypothetical protein F4777DRAFT_578617 [Nemania sp. FL0916]